MKKLFLFLFSVIFFVSCFNKAAIENNIEGLSSNKIKVYILGTFHFGQTDSTYNVLEIKHQKSIKELNDQIVNLKPSKIFIERMPDFEYQHRLDSIYTTYLNGKSDIINPNEIWQVAFRVGKLLDHQRLFQCDHPGRYASLYGQIEQYAQKNNQLEILNFQSKGTTKPQTSIVNTDSLRNEILLIDYIKWLNSKEVQESSHAHYINVFPHIGHTDVYEYKRDVYLLGTQLTTDWYRRNIYIYGKIINQLDYTEQSIFILIGNDHVPILRHLFKSNPYFEVISIDDWLK